jgi:DNA-binding response OmpR family regulator
MSAPRLALVADPARPFGVHLSRELTDEGYQALWVQELEAALELAGDRQPSLVVTELSFPQIRGAEVIRRWLTRVEGRRLAIVTASQDVSAALFAARAGITAVFTKPVVAREVVRAVGHEQPPDRAAGGLTLEEATRRYVLGVVDDSPSLRRAARRLGLDRRSLQRMLARFGWRAPAARHDQEG